MPNEAPNTQIVGQKTKVEFEHFVKSDLLNFMETNGIEKISVDDGGGQKGKISRNADGEWKVNISFDEKL